MRDGRTSLVGHMRRVRDELGRVRGEGVVPRSRETEEARGDAEGGDLELEVERVEFGDGRAERVTGGDHCTQTTTQR